MDVTWLGVKVTNGKNKKIKRKKCCTTFIPLYTCTFIGVLYAIGMVFS